MGNASPPMLSLLYWLFRLMSSLALSWRCFCLCFDRASPTFDPSTRLSRTRQAALMRAQRRTPKRFKLCRQTPSAFCGGLPGPCVPSHLLAF
eukprot:6187277-Pleurochrysis_carterae.AAC.2